MGAGALTAFATTGEGAAVAGALTFTVVSLSKTFAGGAIGAAVAWVLAGASSAFFVTIGSGAFAAAGFVAAALATAFAANAFAAAFSAAALRAAFATAALTAAFTGASALRARAEFFDLLAFDAGFLVVAARETRAAALVLALRAGLAGLDDFAAGLGAFATRLDDLAVGLDTFFVVFLRAAMAHISKREMSTPEPTASRSSRSLGYTPKLARNVRSSPSARRADLCG